MLTQPSDGTTALGNVRNLVRMERNLFQDTLVYGKLKPCSLKRAKMLHETLAFQKLRPLSGG